MSLIIATGSNIGSKKDHLQKAKEELSKNFDLILASRIYTSPAVDYLTQPDFYNQLLEFKLPKMAPQNALELCLSIEEKMGRRRDILKGPRTIDIDIIFWGTVQVKTNSVTIPHPSWQDRSFVVLPLQELPYFETIKNHYKIPQSFTNSASPI